MTSLSLLRTLLLAALAASPSAWAQEASAPDEAAPAAEDGAEPDPSVDRFRVPVDQLAEHFLGSTARPVRFDWRGSPVMVAIHGSELLERNNFGSFRVGSVVRRAFSSLMLEGGAAWVFVTGTESSELLALTPYRQPGRPSRLELDVNVSYPLFEGVVTPLHDLLPPAQMVLFATGGVRYLLYPETLVGERAWGETSTWTELDTWRDVGEGLATPQLRDSDRAFLEEKALGGMGIDPALVHTLVGLTFDAYFQPGLFLSSRALVAVPLLAPVSGTLLGFWWELGLAAGWAF
jgi:hypothetical protein